MADVEASGSTSEAGAEPSVPVASTSGDTSFLGVRKRTDSTVDESFVSSVSVTRSNGSRFKRPRVSAMAFPSSYGRANSIGQGADRLPRPVSLLDDFDDISNASGIFMTPMRHTGGLSRSSSFTAGSRAGSPYVGPDHSLSLSMASSGPSRSSSYSLMRSVSSSSLRTQYSVPIYPDNSARYNMRTTRITVDYATPTTTPDEPSARLLSCSANNVAFFTRGNRVHYKNLTSTSEDVGQLLKLQEAHGNVRCLEINRSKGAGADPDILAVGTSKGYIQLWDVQKKKMTAKWHSKEVTAMAWNGHTLTVGNIKGVIRNYDTRAPPSKMKEQSRKSIRHEAAITTLSWTGDGKFLASGDLSGTVYCWEGGLGPPLQVGEPVQRRKKILQSAKISAVAWCPWKTKVLATGDARGIIRLWNINDQKSSSNALSPGRLETGSVITGMHFSPHCQELLTAHGAQLGIHPPIDLSNPRPSVANALAVHSFPSMGHVFLYRLPIDKPVGDSVLDGTGTKIVYTTPATSKISVCDVWAKRKERKEIKRSPSILTISSVGSSYSLIR